MFVLLNTRPYITAGTRYEQSLNSISNGASLNSVIES